MSQRMSNSQGFLELEQSISVFRARAVGPVNPLMGAMKIFTCKVLASGI